MLLKSTPKTEMKATVIPAHGTADMHNGLGTMVTGSCRGNSALKTAAPSTSLRAGSRLSGGASSAIILSVFDAAWGWENNRNSELCSPGQPGAAVPTWPVMTLRALAADLAEERPQLKAGPDQHAWFQQQVAGAGRGKTAGNGELRIGLALDGARLDVHQS